MSVFTVLKYPISIPPTPEEFWRIPKPLFDKWAAKAGWARWNPASPEFNRTDMANSYATNFGNPETPLRKYLVDELLLLRTMIREYDE